MDSQQYILVMKKIYKIVSLSLASVLWMGFFQLPEDEFPQVGSAVSSGAQKSGTASNANIEVAHEVKKLKGGDPNYAHICIVLDASGSMAPYQEDMISACHNFLRTQRDIAGEETLDIWTFSSSQGIQKIVNFKRLERRHYLKDYMCAGGTPCYDAMLTAMKDLSKRINAKSIKPGVVIFVFLD